MPRPLKQGVSYFPSDVDIYNDFKIMNLLDEFGPIGYLVYDWSIRKIYTNGYYLELDLDQLSLYFTKDIGNKWVKNKRLVVQVIHYCADIGLFDKDLLQQNVMTSAGIQRRYLEITARRQAQGVKKYWLLDKAFLTVPNNSINVYNNSINVDDNSINVDDNATKKSKQNKTKQKEDLCTLFEPDVAFEMFWKDYPRKINKKSASLKFKKVCQDEITYKALMEGLKNQRRLKQWEDSQYIPHPTTWLNGERWNDEISDRQSHSYPGNENKQLPEWYTNQDAIEVDTSGFDEKQLESKIKRLKSEQSEGETK